MNNFNVIMLGASGSGKTVFLSSLFHSLFTQNHRGFFLSMESRYQQNELNKIYQVVAAKDNNWPPGTQRDEISNWKFTCCVQSKKDGKIFPSYSFTYLDYAGGLLTDVEDEEFEHAVENAHTLLGLIDGQKIFQALKKSSRNNFGFLVRY